MAIDPIASAVPKYLYDYSTQLTRRNDAAQKLIPNLSNLIDRYRQTALTFGQGINFLTVATGPASRHDLIDLLYRALPPMRVTDQQVHDVAAAFEEVNRQGLRLSAGGVAPGTDPYADTLVTTLQSAIDNYLANIEPQQQAGQALADYVEQHGIDESVRQQIRKHQNDPDYSFFAAAFLNELAAQDVKNNRSYLYEFLQPRTLPGENPAHWTDLINLLTAAYGSDMVDPTVSAHVFNLLNRGTSPTATLFWTDFQHAMEQHPQAAANFVDTLSDDQILTLLKGTDHIVQLNARGGTQAAQAEAEFIKVLTAGLTSYSTDPALATQYYTRVAALIQKTAPDDFQPLLDPLKNFVGTYFAVTISQPPPGATQRQLDDWAQTSAEQQLAVLNGWHDWIFGYEGQRQDARNNVINWENFGVGVAVTLATSVMSLDPLAGIAVGGASSWVTTWAVAWVNDKLAPFTGDPDGDAIKLRQALARSLQAVATRDLLRNGEITDAHHQVIPFSDKEMKTVLNTPADYYVAGDVQLDLILGQIGNTVLMGEK